MENTAEIDRILKEMEWEDVVSTLDLSILDLLVTAHNPPPPSSPPPPLLPPPPAFPAELDLQSQSVGGQGGGYDGCIPPGASPSMMAAPNMYQEPLCQAGAYSQGQYLPYQWPVEVPSTAAFGHPAAPQQPLHNVPVVMFAEDAKKFLTPVGVLNGEVLYEVPAGYFAQYATAAPQQNNTPDSKRKRQRECPQEEQRPYIKKPLNAFLLYMKEQRPNVAAEIRCRGNGAVNAHLGQKWKSLSKEEQAKYYHQADAEKRLHQQQHPEWSSSENYGKKRKRQRSKAPTRAEDDSQQAKKLRGTMTDSSGGGLHPISWCDGGSSHPDHHDAAAKHPPVSKVGPDQCHPGIYQL